MLLDNYRKDIGFTPYVNTGTMYDLYTGKYRPATNGGWVLDGGLSQCVGVSGRGQTYKSGIAGSLLARSLLVHPLAEAIVYETEGTVNGPERYDDFVPNGQKVSDRIVFRSATEMTLSDFHDMLKEVVENKLEHKKDYIVETPFYDNRNSKPYKAWIPTIILIDSFSRARSGKGDAVYDENSVDSSGMNTLFMTEGGVKTRFMNDLPTRANRAGVYVILTAHVGEKFQLDPYNKSPKQLQYMRNTDKMKNVGSSFEFLTTTLIQTLRAVVLQNKDKKCEYPTKFSTDIEVNQVDTMMVRCKNNASGLQLPFVVSQYQGILDAVTNFNFLRQYKDYGLDIQGNKQAFSPVIYKDHWVKKSNLRELTDNDYALSRALELTAQLCYIQNWWNTWNLPSYVSMTPMQLAEKLDHSNNCNVDRVLQSTGVWSTSKQDRERLTLLDVLQILDKEK